MVSMATPYMILENGGLPKYPIISRVLLILEHSIWCQIKAETHVFLSKVRYVNLLICIFMNINEKLLNEIK